MRAFLLGLVALAVAAPAASAVPLVAVTSGSGILYFDSASPSFTESAAVAGLGPSQSLRGIDARPKTGELHAVAATSASANSNVFSYVIPRYRAQAEFAGVTPVGLAGWADVPAGWDFNPVVDRSRLLNTNDENARISPFTGLHSNDTDITPAATTTLIGAAYDRNEDGAAATTLFAIDRNDSELVRVGGVDGTPSPNGGEATSIGPLGVVLEPAGDAGFEIAPDGTAFAALTADADNRAARTCGSDRAGWAGGTARSDPPGGSPGQHRLSRACTAAPGGATRDDAGGSDHSGRPPRLAPGGACEQAGPAWPRADHAAEAAGTWPLHPAHDGHGRRADGQGPRPPAGHEVARGEAHTASAVSDGPAFEATGTGGGIAGPAEHSPNELTTRPAGFEPATFASGGRRSIH